MYSTLFVIACYFLSAVSAFPNGAGKQACDNYLLPGHRNMYGQIPAQSEESPFHVSVRGGGVVQAGSVVEVKLHGPRHFMGFLLVAASYTDKESFLVGEFLIGEMNVHHTTPMCGGTAVTHTYEWYNSTLDSITFYWKSPEHVFSGNVAFHATFVESYDTFWVSVNGDADVFVAHEMSGSYIPPQQEENTGIDNYTPDFAESTVAYNNEISTSSRQIETTFESTSLPTTMFNENEPTTTATGRDEPEQWEITTTGQPHEAESQSTTGVDRSSADRTAAAMDPEKTTIRPNPTAADDCDHADIKCMKRKVVSGIHNLIMSLELIQKYINPTPEGSTSSRE